MTTDKQMTRGDESDYLDEAADMLSAWAASSFSQRQRERWETLFEQHIEGDQLASTEALMVALDEVEGGEETVVATDLCYLADFVMSDAHAKLTEVKQCMTGEYFLAPGFPVSEEVARTHAAVALDQAKNRLACIARAILPEHSDGGICEAVEGILGPGMASIESIGEAHDYLCEKYNHLKGKLSAADRALASREAKVASVLTAVDTVGHEQVAEAVAECRGIEERATQLGKACSKLASLTFEMGARASANASKDELLDVGSTVLMLLGQLMTLTGIESGEVFDAMREKIAKSFIDDDIPLAEEYCHLVKPRLVAPEGDEVAWVVATASTYKLMLHISGLHFVNLPDSFDVAKASHAVSCVKIYQDALLELASEFGIEAEIKTQPYPQFGDLLEKLKKICNDDSEEWQRVFNGLDLYEDCGNRLALIENTNGPDADAEMASLLPLLSVEGSVAGVGGAVNLGEYHGTQIALQCGFDPHATYQVYALTHESDIGSCVALYAPDLYRQRLACVLGFEPPTMCEMMRHPASEPTIEELRRAILVQIHDGVVELDEKLSEAAGLVEGTQLTLTGNYDCLEIYDKAVYDAYANSHELGQPRDADSLDAASVTVKDY